MPTLDKSHGEYPSKHPSNVMGRKTARARAPGLRQESQYTCMATSLASALKAHGKDVTEADVNKVMGAGPLRGARWEEALATAQYFGMRGTLVIPATLSMLKDWTSRGIPVLIAWNPEGRPWSHASVVVDVDDEENVHVMDPNMPDPGETFRVVPKDDFYKKWMESCGDTMVIRRPAMAVEREITPDGRQVIASQNTLEMNAMSHKVVLPIEGQAKTALSGEISLIVESGGQQGKYNVHDPKGRRTYTSNKRDLGDWLKKAVETNARLQLAGMFGPEFVSVEAEPIPSRVLEDVIFNTDMYRSTYVTYNTKTDKWSLRTGKAAFKEGGYRPYRRYRDDPRWIRARRPGVADDGTPVKRGDKILWWPRTKTIMVGRRAEDAWARFESEAADEAMMSGRYAKSERARMTWQEKTAARASTGLYGFTKRVQMDCEACVRKISRRAMAIAKASFRKDERVVSFLQTHAKKGKSQSARVLLASMKEIGPKVASEMYGGCSKEAGRTEYGMYGFPMKTVRLGLHACAEIKAYAGQVASDLHRRRSDKHALITGFLANHSKKGRCRFSRMLLSYYPEPHVKLATRDSSPKSVGAWLRWADEDLDLERYG